MKNLRRGARGLRFAEPARVCGEIEQLWLPKTQQHSISAQHRSFQPGSAGTRQPTIPTGQKQPGSRSRRPEFCRDPSPSDPNDLGTIPGPAPALTDRYYFKAKTKESEGDSTCLLAELSVGSAIINRANLGGVDMDIQYTTLAGFNVGQSVEAGGRGGGAPAPGSCSRTAKFFLLLRRCGGSSTAVFFFC